MRRLRFAILILCLTPVFFSLPVGAEDELDELREAIAERKAQLEAYENEEQGLFEAIESVDSAARLLRAEAKKAALEADEAYRAQKTLAAQVAELEGTMRAMVMVIPQVALEDSLQVDFIEDDHVIQAFSSNRADQSLHVRILPG